MKEGEGKGGGTRRQAGRQERGMVEGGDYAEQWRNCTHGVTATQRGGLGKLIHMESGFHKIGH